MAPTRSSSTSFLQNSRSKNSKHNTRCEVCGKPIPLHTVRCFACGEKDPIFAELDRMIAAGVRDEEPEITIGAE
jgi:predicted amidophosphoribosyltransferase